METQIQAMRINNQTLGIEFGIEKYAMLVMKSGKRQMKEGIDHEKIRTLQEKETCVTFRQLLSWGKNIKPVIHP